MININKDYEFYGFKLYTHKLIIGKEEHLFNVIVQYNAGLISNTWQQEVLKDSETESEWHRWNKSEIPIWSDNYKFIKNMTEEEMFTILL